MIYSLTPYELQLVSDAQVLLTKNKIIQNVYELFGELAEGYSSALENTTLEQFRNVHAKISRGENYKGLPYVMLDYPRHFSKANIFAIRSFFWWGNFFSITLHLTGKHQQQYAGNIEKAIRQDSLSGWSIGTAQNQWEHHFESDNYVMIKEGMNYELINLPYVKLAKKIPLNKWDDTDSFFTENFKNLITILTA